VLAGFKPDVVHLHHATCLTTEIVDAAQEAGAPVAVSLHDYWLGCPRGQRMRADLSYCPSIEVERCTRCYRETWPFWFPKEPDRAFDQRVFGDYQGRIRETLDRADALIAPSKFTRRVFARDGVDERRIEIVEYGSTSSSTAVRAGRAHSSSALPHRLPRHAAAEQGRPHWSTPSSGSAGRTAASSCTAGAPVPPGHDTASG
jgi:hypothetical protein